jgi:hypothetical protein
VYESKTGASTLNEVQAMIMRFQFHNTGNVDSDDDDIEIEEEEDVVSDDDDIEIEEEEDVVSDDDDVELNEDEGNNDVNNNDLADDIAPLPPPDQQHHDNNEDDNAQLEFNDNFLNLITVGVFNGCIQLITMSFSNLMTYQIRGYKT